MGSQRCPNHTSSYKSGGLSYEQGAPVFCAGFTVWSGLRFADPKPHERIAVLGIVGLGHLSVQYSKAAGFYTIAITHSKDKEDLASKLGADLIVSNGEELKQAGGADVILVTSNSYKAAGESLKGLRPDGRMVLMGFSTEPLIVTSEIIVGSIQNGQEYLYEALDYVAKGKVKVSRNLLSPGYCSGIRERSCWALSRSNKNLVQIPRISNPIFYFHTLGSNRPCG